MQASTNFLPPGENRIHQTNNNDDAIYIYIAIMAHRAPELGKVKCLHHNSEPVFHTTLKICHNSGERHEVSIVPPSPPLPPHSPSSKRGTYDVNTPR